MFRSFATFALLAVTAFAATIPEINVAKIASHAQCNDPQLVHNATIAVGDKLVLLTSIQCAPATTESKREVGVATAELGKRDLWHIWPLCLLFNTCHPAHVPPPPSKPTTSCLTSTAPATTKSQSSSSAPPSSTVSSTPVPTPTPSGPVHVCGAPCTTSCNNDAGVLPPTSDDCGVVDAAIQIFKGQGPTSFVVSPFHVETLSFGTCSYFLINTSDHDLESCWDDLANKGDAAGAACFPPQQPFTSEGLCSSPDGQWSIGAAHA